MLSLPSIRATRPRIRWVSDDGRYIAFQVAKRGDMAGVGRGILIFDLEMYERIRKSQGQ